MVDLYNRLQPMMALRMSVLAVAMVFALAACDDAANQEEGTGAGQSSIERPAEQRPTG